jgi:hypothetical protein
MEPIVYGALALKPWEFGKLTPGELKAMIDGYMWRTEQRQIAVARFVAPIINTCTSHELKRPVTVEMLMGIDAQKKKRDDKTREQVKAEMAELVAEVG